MAGAVDLVSFTESVGNTILAHATCFYAMLPQLVLTPDRPFSLYVTIIHLKPPSQLQSNAFKSIVLVTWATSINANTGGNLISFDVLFRSKSNSMRGSRNFHKRFSVY